MAKQVYDIRPQAGMSGGQSNEALRKYASFDSAKKKWGYFDVTRSALNFEVRKGGVITPVQQQESIPMRFGKFLKKRNLEDPNELKKRKGKKPNIRTIAAIILGGTRDRMLEIAFGNQKVDLMQGANNSHLRRNEDIEKWAIGMYNEMCRQYGEENILSFVVHLDEKNPHVHCAVVPMDERRNKISWHAVFGKNQAEVNANYNAKHDELAIVNKKWGLDRGDDIRLTGAKHRTTEEYWSWLTAECERLKGEVDGLNKQINLINDEIRRANIARKGLTTMIWNQEQALEDLKNDVNTEEYMLQENQSKNNELTVLIQDKQRMLKEKKDLLEETENKLNKLKEKYQELLQQKNDMEQQTREVRKQLDDTRQDELDRLETDLFSQFGRYLTYLPNMIGEQLEDLKNSMTFDQREKFDKMMSRTFLKEMTENYEDIIRTAASFYLGNPSQETLSTLHTGALITSTAGSGGGSGSSWKKKPDEDDEAYKYRCVAMACMVAKRKRRNQIRR